MVDWRSHDHRLEATWSWTGGYMILDWRLHDHVLEVTWPWTGVKLQNCAVMNYGWCPQSGASDMSRKSDLTLSFWDLVQVWTRSEENDSATYALSMSEAHLGTPHLKFLRRIWDGQAGVDHPTFLSILPSSCSSNVRDKVSREWLQAMTWETPWWALGHWVQLGHRDRTQWEGPRGG